MAKYLNIVERILQVAEAHADRIALILPNRRVSYGDFRRLVLATAQHARNRGIGRDSLVAIDIDDIVTKSAAALACALLAAPWVVATSPVILQRKVTFTHLLFAGAAKHEQSATQLRVDASWSVAPPGASSAFDNAGPDDVWMYAQSSGTTGTPKFMAMTHRLNEEGFKRGFGIPEGRQVVASFLAPPGAAISTYALRVLSQGGTVAEGGGLGFLLQSGVNRVSGSPFQFAKLLEFESPPASKIYAAQITGAAATEILLARMLDFFEQIQIWYGVTELGIVTERVVDSLPVDPSNVGKVVANAELVLVDADDRPVRAGHEGIVRIRRTDSQVSGYVGTEDATKALFRDGWLYPGDLGRFSENGELHIVGRSDDRLNLGGVKIDAARVDAIVQSTPGVRDGYCFEDRDESGASYLALLLSLNDGTKPHDAVRQILRAIKASGLFYRVFRAYVTNDVPRTMTGKPVRRLAAEFVQKQKLFNIKLQSPPKRE